MTMVGSPYKIQPRAAPGEHPWFCDYFNSGASALTSSLSSDSGMIINQFAAENT